MCMRRTGVRLHGTVCVLALFAAGALVTTPAMAEPTVDEIIAGLGPIAGADNIVTEQEVRDWVASLPASDQPTAGELDQFIALLPDVPNLPGNQYNMETIVAVFQQVQSQDGGGNSNGGNGVPFPAEALQAILTAVPYADLRQALEQMAGSDGTLTESELRAAVAGLPVEIRPSDADVNNFISYLTTSSSGYSVAGILAQFASVANGNVGGPDTGSDSGNNGGGNNGGGELPIETIRHQLSLIAGDDHILTVDEFRAWAATLPQPPTPAQLERFLSTLPGAGDGSFTVDDAVAHLTATDGGNQGGGEVVDNGGGPDNGGGTDNGNGGTDNGNGGTDNGNGGEVVDNGGDQQPGWNCTFGTNREDCRNSITGQVSVSATGPGAAIAASQTSDISTSGDGQPGIVLQVRPSYDVNTGSSTQVYAHPDMALANSRDITTTGRGSAAINVWGGSGAIRIENSGNLSATGEYAGGINVTTGMRDLGIPGGDITIENSGSIVSGPGSAAIFAQSGSWGDGGDITITNSGNIQSQGWAGIAAHSAGGDISVTNSGNVNTSAGWAAIAVDAEGGSGIVTNSGSINVTGTGAGAISVESDEAEGSTHQSADIQNSGSINLNGEEQNGLEAHAANQVTVVNSGQISSSQYWATGISVDSGTEDVRGSAVVLHSGGINLTGDRSTGVEASTFDGTVNVQNRGSIRATGADSIGVFTVGVFGGSALVNNDGGTIVGGTGATTFGTTTASGEGDGTAFTGSAGILMLGSDINEIYNTGVITSGNGLAIATFEGALTVYEWDDEQQEEVPFVLDIPVADTTVRNRTAGLIDGDIRLGSGDDRIFNEGRITGDIDMAGGTNLIENAASGILTGNSIHVGAGNTLTNAGTISPGGTGVIAETIVVGNFVQTSTGRMVIDINESAGVRNDTINVSGTAELAGTVTPNVIDLNEVVQSEYRILTAQGLTNNGIVANPDAVQVTDTIGYDFSLEQRSNDLYLLAEQQRTASDIAAEAAASGAGGAGSQNIASLGGALESIEESGDPGTSVVLNAIRLQDGPASAAKVMDRIIPQQQGGNAGSASRSGASFGNAMLSCATRDGEYAYTREGKCYYAKLTVRRLDHDASAGSAGVRETGTEAMGGIQFDIGGERRLGLAFGYEDINAKAFSTAQALGSSEGQRFQGGLVLKDQWGPINAYLNLTGNYTDLDNKRFVNLGGFTNALSEQEVMSGLIKLRLSYLRDMGPWYVKPLVDVGASYIHLGGYTETGAGGFNLTVASADKWLFSVMPGLEVGAEMRDAGGTIWRPYIRAGVTLYNDDGLSINARFADAAAGAAGFSVATQLDTVYADIDTGMHVLTASGLNLRFNYEGRYGESTRQHAGTVKLSVPY